MKEFFLAVIGTVVMMMLVHWSTPKAQTLGIESNPLNFENIQLNPSNSFLNPNNSFLNPENSYLNPESKRIVYSNDGMPIGYMVDGKNLFDTDGNRVGYKVRK